ncbi:MAG: DMT family transporter [Candidatus Lokiarchaeota archaeon]|nr:DMT family transporter [Candidatus Lokiarchaeota archaeon]
MAEITPSMGPSKRSIIAIVLLILTTVLWGTSFIITKDITKDVPIFFYIGLRFTIALVGFIPFFPHLKHLNKKILLMGLGTGMLYFFGFAIQTIGLQTTTPGKTGFITGLSVIIVPFIAWIGFKKPLNKRIWVAVVLSVVGMALLLIEGESGIIIGDLLVIICAFFWAFYIIYNDKFVRLVDIYSYSIIQIVVICCTGFIFSFVIQESYGSLSFSPAFWYVMIYMGIVVMTLSILFQNWSQQHISATQTAIIFSLEPVFAVLFDFLIRGVILSIFGWFGCSLIFIAIIITVIKNNDNNENIIE